MRSEPSLKYGYFSAELQFQSPRCLQMFIPCYFWSLASFSLYVLMPMHMSLKQLGCRIEVVSKNHLFIVHSVESQTKLMCHIFVSL